MPRKGGIGVPGRPLTTVATSPSKGLSASTIGRLKAEWAEELKAFRGSSLAKDRWVYLWADGIHFGIRADNAPLCALVVIGEKGIDEAAIRAALA